MKKVKIWVITLWEFFEQQNVSGFPSRPTHTIYKVVTDVHRNFVQKHIGILYN